MRILARAFSTLFCLGMLVPGSQAQEAKQNCLNCETFPRSASPKYRVVRKAGTKNSGLIVNITIRKDQFTREALTALACRLTTDFAGTDVLVRIFDDLQSAKNYVDPWQQEKPAGWTKYENSLRATYIREPRKNIDWIGWYLDPEKKQQEEIQLCPSATKPGSNTTKP